MSTRYLILRVDAPTRDSDGDVLHGRNSEGGGATRRGPPTLSIAIEDGRERDVGALRADPKNAAVLDADAMFSLIKPKTEGPLDAAMLDAALRTMGVLKMPKGLIAVGAHATNFTGQGVRVAVLDTGLGVSHPAFYGKDIATRDFTGEGTSEDDVTDRNGHGTHCAGTICGGPVDGVRVGVGARRNEACHWQSTRRKRRQSRDAPERHAVGSARAEGGHRLDVTWL